VPQWLVVVDIKLTKGGSIFYRFCAKWILMFSKCCTYRPLGIEKI
jgi:hypothetical protein